MSELLKEGGSTLIMNLKQLINKIWIEETMPKPWQVSVLLCTIYKKLDVIDFKNYKVISLLNAPYKDLSNTIVKD